MMNFQEFLAFVPKIVAVPLPAQDAHFKMAPPERIQMLKDLDKESLSPKNAAVLMLVYPKGNIPHLAFILRAAYNGVHSSQVAFPGGKFEQLDVDFNATALRETHEEIGVHPDKMEIIKSLTQIYVPPSNFMVYPFLGICNEEIEFSPDPNEVVAVIELPLMKLLDDAMVINTEIKSSYAESVFTPAFKINEHIVWGATAMMLSELKDVLKKA
jgi:8-oxo-dGTP pyrophosphatase MutT (NUDIX family)